MDSVVCSSLGVKLKDVPEKIRNEIDYKANERFINEYNKLIGGEENGL